jgi:hypothetical protein
MHTSCTAQSSAKCRALFHCSYRPTTQPGSIHWEHIKHPRESNMIQLPVTCPAWCYQKSICLEFMRLSSIGSHCVTREQKDALVDSGLAPFVTLPVHSHRSHNPSPACHILIRVQGPGRSNYHNHWSANAPSKPSHDPSLTLSNQGDFTV